MKQTRSRRALTSVLCGLFLISTFTASFVVPNIASAETIIIESCNVGMIEIRTGDHLTCVDPSPPDVGDGGDDAPGEYDDGGGSGGATPSPAEQRRRARCKQCTAASDTCQAQARLAGKTCLRNAERQAMERCDPATRALSTITAWGCRITDHAQGNCTSAVEAPWNQRSRWGWTCGRTTGRLVCEGPGVDSCVASWRNSHAGGSTSLTTTIEGSAEWSGVGAQGGRTVTVTSTWDGRSGYLTACTQLEMSLDHRCTGLENLCYSMNRCTEADLQ